MIFLIIYLLGEFIVGLKLSWGFIFLLSLFSFVRINKVGGYYFFVDRISRTFCLLSFFIVCLILLSLLGDYKLNQNVRVLLSLFILINLLFVFSTIDLILFYFSFEFVVIPIFLIILLVGNSVERLQASLYMVLYTLISSMPFLIFILISLYSVGSLNFLLKIDMLNPF